jgi:hypothetical protein
LLAGLEQRGTGRVFLLMQNRFARFIPLLVLLGLLLTLGLAFGPRLYRSLQLSRSCTAMLESARAGNLTALASHIDPAQQQAALSLLGQVLPPDYYLHIRSLKLSSLSIEEDGSAWTIVTCRTEDEASGGLYQGKLHWYYRSGRWEWDFQDSYGAQYPLSGAPQWEALESYVRLAGQY